MRKKILICAVLGLVLLNLHVRNQKTDPQGTVEISSAKPDGDGMVTLTYHAETEIVSSKDKK